jgi:hypothetical protein
MRRTKLYNIGHGCVWNSTWAESGGLVWLDSKPHDESPETLFNSGRRIDLGLYEKMVGFIIDVGGPVPTNKWPDWMGAPTAALGHFVSERVVQAMIDEDIPLRRAIEFPIAEIRSPALRKIAPPKYYAIEADVGIDTEAVEVGVPFSNEIVRKIAQRFHRYDTWNGSPLFTAKSPDAENQQYSRLCCDHRVTFLAMKEKWTNFDATELRVI